MKSFIVSAVRTPIGSFGGSLKDTGPEKLGALVLKEAVKRAGLEGKEDKIDEVMMGCILQAGHGQGIARQASIHAGIPQEVPAVTTNILCGSGLYTVIQAARGIGSEDGDIYACGGTENMSQASYLLKNGRYGCKMGHSEIHDSMVLDGLTDAFQDYHMGITAENIAEKYQITREEMDAFALNSQNKAEKAKKQGKFKEEIVPVTIQERKKTWDFSEDEYIREGCTLEALQKPRPAFKKDGTVTAGNASGINDGAAALIVVSEKMVKELNLTPLAEIISWGVSGVDPAIMGIGPVPSTEKALKKAGLTIDDIDLIEANEAFAVQSIAVMRDLKMDPDKVNINGGAIALGHPIGASGARILVTLLHSLKAENKTLGLATLCVGGGMGVSVIVKKV